MQRSGIRSGSQGSATPDRSTLNWNPGRWVAGPLALVTPFISLLRYEGYPLLNPESLGFIGLLGLLGLPTGLGLGSQSRRVRAVSGGLLIALFCELQFHGSIGTPAIFIGILALGTLTAWLLHEHIASILGTVFATFLASSLLLPGEQARIIENHGEEVAAGEADLPIVLHVVFDEMVGIDGVPLEIEGGEALRRDLEMFFTTRGFRVYPKAFSSYHNTKTSLSQLVNFKGEFTPHLVERGGDGFEWRVLQNAYFDEMTKQGYRTSIIQSNYLDFCRSSEKPPANCRTYPSWGLAFAAEQKWSVGTKVVLFARLYPLYSKTYSWLRKRYSRFRAQQGLAEASLPAWSWELFRPPSVSSLREMERLAEEIGRARRGDFLFAHLLLPHSPFAMNADCSVREPSRWLDHKSRSLPAGRVNTPATRDARFRAHFEQVRCTLNRLDRILASLSQNPEASDAVVVIHGDHGARISMYDARYKHRESLTPADYVGTFSTVYSVRAPGVEPGKSLGMISIQNLFGETFASEFSGAPEEGLEDREALIYFTKSRKRVVTSGPMPPFGRDIRD